MIQTVEVETSRSADLLPNALCRNIVSAMATTIPISGGIPTSNSPESQARNAATA